MNLVGSAIGRMAYGAGTIANQYVDQEIQTQKAQALSDIQRQGAMQLDQYNQSPERQAQVRENTTQATLAEGAAKHQADVNAAMDDRGNTALSAVAAERAGRVARATAENTPHDVAPGGEVIIGAGKNPNKTAGQWSYEAYAEGLKGANREDRDRMTEQHLAGINGQIGKWQDAMAKGMENGTISPKPPADGKNTDSYDRYLAMQAEVARLEQARGMIIGAARDRSVVNPKLNGATAAPAEPPVPTAAGVPAPVQAAGAATGVQPQPGIMDSIKGAVQGIGDAFGSPASDERRKQEAAQYTPDVIQGMSRFQRYRIGNLYGDVLSPESKAALEAPAVAPPVPKEAQPYNSIQAIKALPYQDLYKINNKYGDVLSPEVRDALIRRMSEGR